jgi:hypothetical protein
MAVNVKDAAGILSDPKRFTIVRLHRHPRLGYAFINASQRTFRINDLAT